VAKGKELRAWSVVMDAGLYKIFCGLVRRLGQSNRADIFRLAITILNIAVEAREHGAHVAITDSNGTFIREIVLPNFPEPIR
jgi:hypothetical protein